MKTKSLFILAGITGVMLTLHSTAYSQKSVKIGSQVWTAENLNVSAFRNGDAIPEAETPELWMKAVNDEKPAWCYYKGDAANGKKYGKLYNWYAVHDSSGFSALPVGICNDDGSTTDMEQYAYFWSSSDAGLNRIMADFYPMSFESTGVHDNSTEKGSGMSCRCVKN